MFSLLPLIFSTAHPFIQLESQLAGVKIKSPSYIHRHNALKFEAKHYVKTGELGSMLVYALMELRVTELDREAQASDSDKAAITQEIQDKKGKTKKTDLIKNKKKLKEVLLAGVEKEKADTIAKQIKAGYGGEWLKDMDLEKGINKKKNRKISSVTELR